MSQTNPSIKNLASFAGESETAAYDKISAALRQSPIPPNETLQNMALFLNRTAMAHLLYLHDLYLRALDVQGIIVEFGSRWGRNLASFIEFRTIYEPHNFARQLVSFDTFEGFPSVSAKDGRDPVIAQRALSVTAGYEQYLEELLAAHEALGPRPHLRKFEIVKGDVMQTLPRYLEEHPETIIALAYFDMDLYEPTKRCLELISDRLTKGSVVAFDQLALRSFPGETVALREAWGLGRHKIHRDPRVPFESFVVIE